MCPLPPRSTLFPYTTLFRSQWVGMGRELYAAEPVFRESIDACAEALAPHVDWSLVEVLSGGSLEDRKSTRLNSSHLGISYAVFCLKKKKRDNRSNRWK